MDYSHLIKEYRRLMYISQRDLAVILGVSVPSVARWESGVCNPTKKTKRKLESLLRSVTLGDTEND